MDRDTDAQGVPMNSCRRALRLRTAVSSGESVPVIVLTTNADNFISAFARKYPGSFTHSSTRVPRPVFAANAITGTRSADDTGFGTKPSERGSEHVEHHSDHDDSGGAHDG